MRLVRVAQNQTNAQASPWAALRFAARKIGVLRKLFGCCCSGRNAMESSGPAQRRLSIPRQKSRTAGSRSHADPMNLFAA